MADLDGTNLDPTRVCVMSLPLLVWDHMHSSWETVLAEIAAGKSSGYHQIPIHPVIIGSTQPENSGRYSEKARQLNAEIIFADQKEYRRSITLILSWKLSATEHIQTAIVGLQSFEWDSNSIPQKLENGLMKV